MSCEALNCSKLPVAFVHVSGSGGTSVCNAAAAMGVRTPSVRAVDARRDVKGLRHDSLDRVFQKDCMAKVQRTEAVHCICPLAVAKVAFVLEEVDGM